MKYSALIFDEGLKSEQSLKNLDELSQILKEDPNCRQIVVSCNQDEILHLAKTPISKAMYVAKLDEKYASLLNALKAVVEENVLILGLSSKITALDLNRAIDELKQIPAVSFNENLRGFDTRLMMFALQKAMNERLEMNDYIDAIAQYADFPCKSI